MAYEPYLRPNVAGTPEFVQDEINAFGNSVERFVAGQLDERVFLEYRLRHGVYGQRQDGVHMLRSKLPLGLLSPEQMDSFADVAEVYGHGIAHLTTRQDIQVHFVPLKKTADLMRTMAKTNMTAREACGNVVRNVCGSPVSGLLDDSAFDITPWGMALTKALLRHPDGQSLGRKFKITFADSFDPVYNLSVIHDVGATAVLKEIDGKMVKGFKVLVGGGLGAVPHEAQPISEWMPAGDLLPTCLAILRLFGVHGEKKNRARARLKFVVAKWGIEKFREEVAKEIAAHPNDPQLTVENEEIWADRPIHPPNTNFPQGTTERQKAWLRTNVIRQAQDGYAVVKVRVPQGDLTPDQLRKLASLLRKEVGDTTRIGVEQQLFIRCVAFDRLLALQEGLDSIGLGGSQSHGVADPITCPGADTCKLGITSPRSLARQINDKLEKLAKNPKIEKLRIHVSGCPNSCAQTQIADIGLFGASRTVEGVTAPFFMMVLGGQMGGVGSGAKLGDGFGKAMLKVPAYQVGNAVEALATAYAEQSEEEETFGAFINRLGRKPIKELLAPYKDIPKPSEMPEAYREFGSEGDFKMQRGVGECAGDIVALSDLLMADADRLADEATALYEENADKGRIVKVAHQAMDIAAKALLTTTGIQNPDGYDIPKEFKTRFYDSGRIYEGVGHYYLFASAEDPSSVEGDRLRRLVEESMLFVEETHTILGRIQNPKEAQ